jgi:hypothetical protein
MATSSLNPSQLFIYSRSPQSKLYDICKCKRMITRIKQQYVESCILGLSKNVFKTATVFIASSARGR